MRRALLARIFLATSEPPIWNFEGDEDIGARLDDPETGDKWRSSWHNALHSLDALEAVDRPPAAVRFASLEDR